MASKEATFPGPHCKNVNISIEGLIWMGQDGDVSKLSYDDFSKAGYFYELNQYRKADNVDWEDFYAQIQVLTEEKVPNWQR